MNEISLGSILDGRYHIKACHSGGMANVFKAYDLLWNRHVAIKLPKTHGHSPGFVNECKLWRDLGIHPYITTCYYTKTIARAKAIVCEYVEGGSLFDSLRDHSLYQASYDQNLFRVFGILLSSVSAMASAHRINLIHSDIKPGNILLLPSGICKVTDFGVSSFQKSNDRFNVSLGFTPAYSAPEQLLGLGSILASDVWGWATMVLEVFYGKTMWRSGVEAPAYLEALFTHADKIGPPLRIPPGLYSTLVKCLSREPSARISFADIFTELSSICNDMFGECPDISIHDENLFSADSTNNRAVAHYDEGNLSEVKTLLAQAIKLDEFHPEANFNSVMVKLNGAIGVRTAISNLEFTASLDCSSVEPCIYLIVIGMICSDTAGVKKYTALAQARVRDSVNWELYDLYVRSLYEKRQLAFSCMRSGDDLVNDTNRFSRLLKKAELAMRSNRREDASRYVMMCADIPSFARHKSVIALRSMTKGSPNG